MFDYLQPGNLVKDAAGIHKTITRVESGKVYCVYNDRSDRRQHIAEYDRFIDTHFIIAGTDRASPTRPELEFLHAHSCSHYADPPVRATSVRNAA